MSTNQPVSVRKYLALISILGLFAILAVSALLNGDGKTMADADGAGTSTSGQDIENVAVSKSMSTGTKVGSVCRDFGSTYTCVPTHTPRGSIVIKLYEDGSARMENGSVYDPDTRNFR